MGPGRKNRPNSWDGLICATSVESGGIVDEDLNRRKIRCHEGAGKVDEARRRWEVAPTPGAGENEYDADPFRSASDPNSAIGP